jgi:hypothetical protein
VIVYGARSALRGLALDDRDDPLVRVHVELMDDGEREPLRQVRAIVVAALLPVGAIPKTTDPFVVGLARLGLDRNPAGRGFDKVEEGPCQPIAIVHPERSKEQGGLLVRYRTPDALKMNLIQCDNLLRSARIGQWP